MATTTSTPTPSRTKVPPSPEPIMRLASGFMTAKHLFAASELGIFEALADPPATIEALAARTGLTRRAARISADAMVAVGLLERTGDLYRNSDVAATFLAGATPADLRPFLRFWDKISFLAWGTGSWSVAVVEAHPHMQATVFELPAVAEVARRRITSAGLSPRVAVVAGDATAAPLPAGHDVCLVANLFHYFSPDENKHLLASVRAAVDAGARLLIADFWTDATHTEPLIAALMAGEFAVHVRHGDVYSAVEAHQWLETTGWRFGDHVPLADPVSLVTAEAV